MCLESLNRQNIISQNEQISLTGGQIWFKCVTINSKRWLQTKTNIVKSPEINITIYYKKHCSPKNCEPYLLGGGGGGGGAPLDGGGGGGLFLTPPDFPPPKREI